MLFDPFESAVLFLAVIIVNQGQYHRYCLGTSENAKARIVSFQSFGGRQDQLDVSHIACGDGLVFDRELT